MLCGSTVMTRSTKGILEYDCQDPIAIAELEKDYKAFIQMCKDGNIEKKKWPSLRKFAAIRMRMMVDDGHYI
tara:strand:- start:136 stop:351 length:216 start_codon:yes stop_codon:yes gene_type:complete